ncbi:MAG: UvrD-helicase domain-containing protein [Streptococcaceae bacterium]|jgi:DNA helicase-2/ATP-dependent DNA helicase PcrA|nr:UvrD-helicase domain-containing protein [Streptococcaceae bacterium]
MKLLNEMNLKQKEAVEYIKGPLLVMAGAGSGKTRVLTHRIAYLIKEKRVNPWNILAITFTNKAAFEMKKRVANLLGNIGEDVFISTFHSMCMRILRIESEKIGLCKNFTIIDSSEQKTLINRILKELNLSLRQFVASKILSMINQAKNELLTPEEYQKQIQKKDKNINIRYYEENVAKVYKRYQEELKNNKIIDFDDLIMNTVHLFQEIPDTLVRYQEKFHYIHVDEYQDTNHAQYVLVNLLAKRLHNLCVVGDEDQSIYGWRGADMQNILNFEKDYPDAKVIMLTQNYRSTKQILEAANSIIKNNQNRYEKDLWTENIKGKIVTYYHAKSGEDEADYIAREIKRQVNENSRDYSDFAVLYRINAISRLVEERFLKENIPHIILGGHKFYERKEIKDLIAYLNLIMNPVDSISFLRIVNEPIRGVGEVALQSLIYFAKFYNLSLLEAAKDDVLISVYDENVKPNNDKKDKFISVKELENFSEDHDLFFYDLKEKLTFSKMSKKAARNLVNFANAIEEFRKLVHKTNISITDLVEKVLDQTEYKSALQRKGTIETEKRLENLEEFLNVTKRFDKEFARKEHTKEEQQTRLATFLSDVSLVSDVDNLDKKIKNQVTLMTFHSAKGLEFPIVFLIGMERGIFPKTTALKDQKKLEEERRLAYVGITRAREELYLMNAHKRMSHGEYNFNKVSPFIKEIDEKFLNYIEAVQKRLGNGNDDSIFYDFDNFHYGEDIKKIETPSFKSKSSIFCKNFNNKVKEDSTKDWRTGDKLEHKLWGVGIVGGISDNGKDLKVIFSNKGVKQISVAYAPIKKIKQD